MTDPLLAELDRDPYAVYSRLRATGPLVWIAPLRMWYALDHAVIRGILADDQTFSTGGDASPVERTFGSIMLTSDGPERVRLRAPFKHAFTPSAVRSRLTTGLGAIIAKLADGFPAEGVELRAALASRLPILAMLDLFGLGREHETILRRWYDAFEAALSNFQLLPGPQVAAAACMSEFHALIAERLEEVRHRPGEDLLSEAAGAPTLSNDEIIRNAALIFFGGISTVEALILNTVYALLAHPDALALLRAQPSHVAHAIEETMRWQAPVQSATRHARRAAEIGGIKIAAGDTVNCMLGAANRDPSVFAEPDRFDLSRRNAGQHLGFASGPHFCLGLHLARLEVRMAVEELLHRYPRLALDPSHATMIRGYEFRQPRALHVRW